jgi:ParB family transcriptional regulator, chromosome partitioning protein
MNAMNAENRVDGVEAQSGPPVEEVPGAAGSNPAVVPPEQPGAEASALPSKGEEAPAPPEVREEVVAPRRRGHVAPAHIPLERIDEDTTFQFHPLGDLSALATDLARLGQLFPVDVRFKPPDRFQIISGFRRVAALRFLKRDRVLARLHTDLSDEDALLMALAAAIHSAPVDREQLAARRDELEAAGRLTPIAREMLEKALATEDSLAPETVEEEEEEVDADELAVQATQRLGEINQDLALLADVFGELDAARQEELLTQLRYSVDLVNWLESLR